MTTQLPNLLTLFRIIICPVLVLLLYEKDYAMALLVFTIAGITDGLDGYIAKKYGCVTELGAILDPIADKLLIASTYIMLGLIGDIPFWLLILVIFRDLVIIAGYSIIGLTQGNAPIVRPSTISKINTFMQILLMVLVLLVQATDITLPWVIESLIVIVAITTVYSGIQYLWQSIFPQQSSSCSHNESTNRNTVQPR